MEKENSITRFNVRVYFLLTNGNGEILVSDEIIRGAAYTKFPGGGLEYGEGILECLAREAMEELGQPIVIGEHLYTTDFFVQSAFRPADQVISVYYTAELPGPQQFRTTAKKFDFIQLEKDEESFRWIKSSFLMMEEWKFPSDSAAVEAYLTKYQGKMDVKLHDQAT